ncbi:hypothetical protein BKA93DRAFT_776769 [Sparassis latifolia]
MSRQPSPGPSHLSLQPTYHSPVVLANPAFQQPKPQRQKAYVSGITAGVEDVKYQAKYKDLKKKVKEIETDNDRLYFKLLLAKKNIRRMNLERAILYERLAAVPPTPGRHPQELPLVEDPLFHPQAPLPPESMIDPNDHALVEYMRTHPNARLIQAPDGRVIAVEDTPAPIVHGEVNTMIPQPPPHELPLVHSFHHDSGPGYDPNRQLPPLPPMISPLRAPESPSQGLPPMGEHHHHHYPPGHPHAHAHTSSHSSSSSHHASSARPDLDALAGGSRMEPLPMHSRSPSTGDDRRRPAPLPVPTHPQMPASPPPSAPSPTSTRSTGGSIGGNSRIHNHQRIGPGANIHREMAQREARELEALRQREMEAELYERDVAYQSRMDVEEQDEAAATGAAQWRNDAPLVGPGVSHGTSRADTPNGNSANRTPTRPASGEAYEYDREHERSRSYGSRVYEEHEDRAGHMPPVDVGAVAMESRKRSRSDIEAGDDYDGEIRSPIEGGAAGRPSPLSGSSASDGRAAKRMHPGDDEGGSGERRDEPMDEDA